MDRNGLWLWKKYKYTAAKRGNTDFHDKIIKILIVEQNQLEWES